MTHKKFVVSYQYKTPSGDIVADSEVIGMDALAYAIDDILRIPGGEVISITRKL